MHPHASTKPQMTIRLSAQSNPLPNNEASLVSDIEIARESTIDSIHVGIPIYDIVFMAGVLIGSIFIGWLYCVAKMK